MRVVNGRYSGAKVFTPMPLEVRRKHLGFSLRVGFEE